MNTGWNHNIHYTTSSCGHALDAGSGQGLLVASSRLDNPHCQPTIDPRKG